MAWDRRCSNSRWKTLLFAGGKGDFMSPSSSFTVAMFPFQAICALPRSGSWKKKWRRERGGRQRVIEQRGHADYQRWKGKEGRPSEVWIRTVVCYSCCITATKKPKSWGRGPVNPRKPTPETRCQATRSICVNWEYREKRDGALLIIESGNGSTGWLGAEALRSVYLGASSRSPALSPPTLHSFFLSFFLPPPSVLVGPHPPTGWSGRPFGFVTDEI